MMKIAAICALPLKNPGMVSVDSALDDFLRRNRIDASVDYFSAVGGALADAGAARFHRREHMVLSDLGRLRSYDRIVIWGDFLNSFSYIDHISKLVGEAEARQPDGPAADYVHRTLMLEGADEATLAKVICFGGSIYLNRPVDDWDVRYREAISRLYRNCRLVLMRDPLSAAFAQQFGAAGSALGIDPAFLLDRDKGAAPRVRRTIGFSFGRALGRRQVANYLQARRFVALCRRKAGLEREIDLRWLKSDRDRPLAYLESRLELIRQCALVVTDTYHCAINAWREGVPAICLGIGSEHPSGTLSEKKKELLFSMLNARDFYVFTERLGLLSAGREASRVVAAANDNATVTAIERNIDLARNRAEQALARALTSNA